VRAAQKTLLCGVVAGVAFCPVGLRLPGLRGREGAVFARWGVALPAAKIPNFYYPENYRHPPFFFFNKTKNPTPPTPKTPPKTTKKNFCIKIRKNKKPKYKKKTILKKNIKKKKK
ncbi:hypothetical protein, partial [Enterobacter intestinihominis]